MTPKIGIESYRSGATVVVVVSGEMDLGTAPYVARQLRQVEHTAADVIIDLAQVEFMDCAGLRVLVRFAGLHGRGPAQFFVTPGPPQVQKLFRLSGMEAELRVVDPARGRPRWSGQSVRRGAAESSRHRVAATRHRQGR